MSTGVMDAGAQSDGLTTSWGVVSVVSVSERGLEPPRAKSSLGPQPVWPSRSVADIEDIRSTGIQHTGRICDEVPGDGRVTPDGDRLTPTKITIPSGIFICVVAFLLLWTSVRSNTIMPSDRSTRACRRSRPWSAHL